MLEFKKLVKFTKHLKKKCSAKGINLSLYLITNGDFLDASIIDFLKINKFYVQLHLQLPLSSNIELKNQDTDSKNKNKDVELNQLSKIKLLIDTKINFAVRITPSPKTIRYLFEAYKIATIIHVPRLIICPAINSEWPKDSLSEFSDNLAKIMKDASDISVQKKPFISMRFGCGAYSKILAVSVTGKIFPCEYFANSDKSRFQIKSINNRKLISMKYLKNSKKKKNFPKIALCETYLSDGTMNSLNIRESNRKLAQILRKYYSAYLKTIKKNLIASK